MPIGIQGVRRAHRSLFARLDRPRIPRHGRGLSGSTWRSSSRWGNGGRSPPPRAPVPAEQLSSVPAGLDAGRQLPGRGRAERVGGKPIRSSPTFHAGPITDLHAPAYVLYLVERMRESARSNAVESQFDLLYEFVQDELRRRHPGVPAFTLYRGVKNLGDYRVIGEAGENRVVLRLNNLNSFSSRLEHAWEFGSCVLVAEVPDRRSSSAPIFSPASSPGARRSRW